ncbi:hypothetical protein [Streptomyces sp. NPDC048436]|uniref:hypothetical protein n=1 Tax=Streptomyces sp. NPDC048436 TaxID=3365550 RepID=UPI003721A44A
MTTSLTPPQLHRSAGTRRGGLAAYYAAALAIRTSDAGSAAAIVLLALHTARDGHPSLGTYAGLLASCLTIPHMLGPLSARALSLIPNARLGLTTAFALFAMTFGAAGLLMAHAHIAMAALCLVIAGFLGPILTGGLSSHLGSLLPDNRATQRRAQSADSLTYAISNSVGNSMVGAVAVLISPLATMMVLAALAALAALLATLLPLRDIPRASASRASVKNVLLVMVKTKGLRDIMIITYGNAIGFTSLIVLATTFARSQHLPAATGPFLLAVMGGGSLLVGVWFTARPLTVDVVRAAKWCAVASGVFMFLPALGQTWSAAVAFLAVGGCQSVLNTAALAVRREASPPDLRESVFVTMAGAKVGVATLGLALAGLVPVDAMPYGFAAAGLLSLLAGLSVRGNK